MVHDGSSKNALGKWDVDIDATPIRRGLPDVKERIGNRLASFVGNSGKKVRTNLVKRRRDWLSNADLQVISVGIVVDV